LVNIELKKSESEYYSSDSYSFGDDQEVDGDGQLKEKVIREKKPKKKKEPTPQSSVDSSEHGYTIPSSRSGQSSFR
jgi:hypothetical protein